MFIQKDLLKVLDAAVIIIFQAFTYLQSHPAAFKEVAFYRSQPSSWLFAGAASKISMAVLSGAHQVDPFH